jgi:hypothetical protein
MENIQIHFGRNLFCTTIIQGYKDVQKDNLRAWRPNGVLLNMMFPCLWASMVVLRLWMN